MAKFLFWNLQGKPVTENIVRLARRHDVDMLMFAEFSLSPADLLSALNADGQGNYHYAPSPGCQKVHIFPRFADRFLPIAEESNRVTIRRLILPNSPEVLLVVVHLVSKLRYSDASQTEEAKELARTVRDAEDRAGHQRTILCGDLNMNPFEAGLVEAGALNAAMTRGTAQARNRTIQGRIYPYFYNPMWGHFGDWTDTPPGTYYYAQADHLCYYWNIFDQVLIRPDLLGTWRGSSLAILDGDGQQEFRTASGKSAKEGLPDHLPLVFELAL